ncbi:ABC transporter ATP-binding protein [Danxiaibacter flavus]|uniref:ABC transporter ATP-binding protein n=1 Tax=Danxiaibacter flavus TaxID=3049108 RepID=A0ABV3ZE97_9BACT|nr:ABC transporter ATP-binding protein [Chitinophagaceae bacterium DXS]
MSNIRAKLKKWYRNVHPKQALQLIWKISSKRIIISLCLILIENACWAGTVYSLKLLMDQFAGGQARLNRDAVIYYLVFAASIGVLYVCIKSVSAFVSDSLASRIDCEIDEQIHAHTLKLDLSYYEDPAYLDILKRAREAGANKPKAIILSLNDLAKNSIMLVAMIYMLIATNWLLLPLLCMIVLPILFVRIKFSDRQYLWQRDNAALERETTYLSHLMTGDAAAKEIRAFALGNFLLEKYGKIKHRLVNELIQLEKRKMIVEIATTLLATLAFFSVMAVIIMATLKGKASFGDIAVFLVIFPQSFSTVQGLIGAISRFYQNNIYIADIFELLHLKPLMNAAGEGNTNAIRQNPPHIAIENLSFKYPHSKNFVLNNISLIIPPGKIVALVGMNGAGKSTLIKLLCRLYDPLNGRITINGTDIRDLDVSWYRRQVSVVFQDYVKYNFSASDNIWFGNIQKEREPDEIENAARLSGADDVLKRFSNGYNTILGRTFDGGKELSIGEWQKLAIARAFYAESGLIILDEATSALDAFSENDLFRSLRERIGDRSALVISHRLSTIMQADHIYVIEDQKVIESGNHTDLIQRKGRYSKMFSIEHA